MKKTSLILLFLVFFIPVLLAIVLHSQWLEWQPESSRAHGELIQPVVPLGDFAHESNDRTVDQDDLLDKWQLVHVSPGGCGPDCLEFLYWLRQIRTAQDRHQPEIGLLVISGTSLAAEIRAEIHELSPDYRIIDGATGAELAERFPGPRDPSGYILDPEGNIILRYPADADPNGIRRDLRRLLTWTQRD